jgi:hypothetical protein
MIFLLLSACQSSLQEETNSSSSTLESSSTSSPSTTESWMFDAAAPEYLRAQQEYERELKENRQKEELLISNANEKPHQQLVTKTYPEKVAFEKKLIYYLADQSWLVSHFTLRTCSHSRSSNVCKCEI